MAKKFQIGLAVYALKEHPVSVCDGCNTAFEYPRRLYEAIKYDKPGKHYCLGCIKKMQGDFQEKAKKQAFEFPIRKKLYVGSNHRCGEGLDHFVYRLAYFKLGKAGRLIPLRQCQKCGEFFILLSDGKKNAKYLQQYILMNPQTQKQMYIPYITKDMFAGKEYSNQGKPAEATPLEQWAAKHPYQGGGFSGK